MRREWLSRPFRPPGDSASRPRHECLGCALWGLQPLGCCGLARAWLSRPFRARGDLIPRRDPGMNAWAVVSGAFSPLVVVDLPEHGSLGRSALRVLAYSNVSPMAFPRKAQRSATSSMTLAVGLPAPWPALVSMRRRMGASPPWACWRAAPYLKLWAG